jgi:RHH-type proline utilization regulon transcriptional repressor/proline dehydrogenase/delta 1-pyrroline-5-carboxylate dehydrogenase
MGLISREAGKSLPNAVGEVREAVDFLRFYAAEALRVLGSEHRPALGPILCISPWNFPLAIFTGQVAAALAAGNPVLAKPAEETPLVAAEAVRILHASGIPEDALQLVPGAGDVGAALVADPRIMGVMFTGSTEVAKLIQRQLAGRLTRAGHPIPFIAETGGLNALVVDSSALPEQVVGDVLMSAFDSAGQRCSALRILCVQNDAADRVITMLKGAMDELTLGCPDRLATDVGPVISLDARENILRHVEAMRARGHAVHQLSRPPGSEHGTFVPPTLIEISAIADVEREVFGPVLHVLRFQRDDLDRLIRDVNASGYGLTFGLHTRIDETVSRVVSRIEAGNVYVNRNIIGAVVGVQPFGGSGLSGTGPKAGGPLYLRRLLSRPPQGAAPDTKATSAALAPAHLYADWLRETGREQEAERVLGYLSRSALGAEIELGGPVGERNIYALRPRGRVAACGSSERTLLIQLGAILATGNLAAVAPDAPAARVLRDLPASLKAHLVTEPDPARAAGIRALLADAEGADLIALQTRVAEREGPILAVQSLTAEALAAGEDYDLAPLLEEVSISTNTAAAGGNASLMAIG